VHSDVGFKVPLTSEGEVVSAIASILEDLSHDRARLDRLRQRAMCYARESLSWDAKARKVTGILEWALRQRAGAIESTQMAATLSSSTITH
jgi:hypothetical protein